MKPIVRFVVGTCCGAVAAFLYLAVDSARSLTSPTELAADRTRNYADSDVAPTVLVSTSERAATEPLNALREALAIESAFTRTNASAGVARIWARQDPEAALAAAAEVPAASRSDYLDAVAREWAFVDPAGFFAYAEAANSIDELIDGLEVLIATDPQRVFEIAARFNAPAQPDIEALYLHAVRGMAGRDPAGTIARLQFIATGAQRDPILVSIAEAYSAIDAKAALAWAMSVVPPSPDALSEVIETVASGDLLAAYAMLQQVPGGGVSAGSLGTALVEAALRGRQPAAPLASALAVRAEPEAVVLLTRLMQQWAQREPENAVAWMAGNEAYLTDELTSAVVFNIAFEDVSLAAELADRVPPSAQRQWLDAVANRYGQFDAEAGMAWLARYEGVSGYDKLLNSLLGGASRSSPEFVAEYIETSGALFDRNLVLRTASSFVEQNPEAATQWAMRIDDTEHSAWALEGVVDRWSQTDGSAATRWVLSQPRGAARDRLLGTMMLSSAISPSIDPAAILDAYASEATGQRMLAEYIFRATRVPRSMLDDSLARAEPLLELISDPVFRQQAEEQIAAAR
jgi:hypothetical protein